MMTFYRTQPGESPAMIARKLNTSVGALIAANRHKPTTVVAGKRTWHGLRHNELVHIPRAGVGALGDPGMLGAITPAAPGAPHALIKSGSSGPDVALWQTIIGVKADGIFGSGTAAATKAWQGTHGVAADGIVGPNTWRAALGGAAPTAAAAPPPLAAPSSSLTTTARTALTALSGDANYCTSVARAGTPVNTAVHNFKAAWNAANPGRAVPIGTGKYEISVAAALWSALGGQVDVPPGCGAAGVPAATPTYVPPVAQIPGPQTVQLPTGPAVVIQGASIPAAVQALASINPCLQANSGTVFLAQTALGIKPDGKYGVGTAAAARALGVNAPAGCSPPPLWWGAKGTAQATAATTTAATQANNSSLGPAQGVTQQTVDPAIAAAADLLKAKAAQAAADALLKAAADAKVAGDLKTAADAKAAADLAQANADRLAAQAGAGGGTTTAGGGGITAPAATKGLSKGAIVAGAVGAAAVVGLLAMAAMGKKPGHRGARGARGPARRKKSSKKRKKSSKRKR
jgi:peptidoglycan hydrolase-like protein with peptidoglycan-binding domain